MHRYWTWCCILEDFLSASPPVCLPGLSLGSFSPVSSFLGASALSPLYACPGMATTFPPLPTSLTAFRDVPPHKWLGFRVSGPPLGYSFRYELWYDVMHMLWARFQSLSQTCLRTVLDSNNLLSFLAETIWFSVAVLATRSKTAAKSAHPVTCSCLSTFWDNWTGVTKVPQVTQRKIWK